MDPKEDLKKKTVRLGRLYLHEWDLLGAVGPDEPEPRVRLDAEQHRLVRQARLERRLHGAGALRQALARGDEARHALPALGVDLERDGGVGRALGPLRHGLVIKVGVELSEHAVLHLEDLNLREEVDLVGGDSLARTIADLHRAVPQQQDSQAMRTEGWAVIGAEAR